MLAASMTRRLVAILSADAVGYSRLMAADEAGALAIYVHFTAQVRRALPTDVAKRARDEGRALSVEEAFDLALAMLPA